jgi:hypothetical protein
MENLFPTGIPSPDLPSRNELLHLLSYTSPRLTDIGTYKRNIEARSRKNCYHAEAICITYSECVSVALVIQHAKRMLRVMSSSSACLVPPCVPTLSHKRHDFRKNNIEHKICFDFLYKFCLKHV